MYARVAHEDVEPTFANCGSDSSFIVVGTADVPHDELDVRRERLGGFLSVQHDDVVAVLDEVVDDRPANA